MSDVARRPNSPMASDILNLLAVAVPLVVLAVIGQFGAVPGLAVVIVALAAAWILSHLVATRDSDLTAVPLLLALGFVVLAVRPELFGSVIAGAAGLAIVYWISRDRRAVYRGRDVARALLLPTVALLLAVGSATLLPAPSAAIGIAAAIVAGVLLLIAALYRSALTGIPAPPPAS